MDILIPFVLLFALLLAGLNVSLSLLAAGVVGIILVDSPTTALALFATEPFREAANYALVTIPMFILMAELITKGRIASDVFTALRAWTTRLPGGTAIATMYAGAGLGAVSGSSAASASMIGRVAIPELKREGNSPEFAVGSVAVAGTLAVMIPPSTVLLLYALLTGTSIAGMLFAGILPGLVTATILALYVLIRSRYVARSRPATAPAAHDARPVRAGRALLSIWPFAVLIVAILGSIYLGLASAIESSALGVLFSLVILVVMRRVSFADVLHALRDTVHLTSMIFMIIVGAGFFGVYLALSQVPVRLAETIAELGIGRWGVLLIILLAVFVLGFFMDQVAIMSLTLPIVFPIVSELGFNAIWFGVLFACLAEIGLVTPPLGLNVYVASSAGGEPPEVGFRGVWPFVLVLLGVVGLLIAVPDITYVLVPEGLR